MVMVRAAREGVLRWRSRVLDSVPFAGLACGALAGALGAGLWFWALAFVVLGFFLSRRGWWWKAAVIAMIILTGWRQESLDSSDALSQRTQRSVTGELVVDRLMRVDGETRIGLLRFEDGSSMRVAVPQAVAFSAGDILRVTGWLFSPTQVRNPGEFSNFQQWQRHSLEAGFYVQEFEHLGVDWRQSPWRIAEAGRSSIRSLVTRGITHDAKASSIILAMVLGETPHSSSEITQAFRLSGAMHVFAVSGLHVTIVGGLMWGVLMVLRVPRRPSIMLIIVAMIGYALMTGGRPPAMRATLMATIFLSAFLLRRRPSLLNALALSIVLVVLWDPIQVREIGFQLSYGVITAISLGFHVAYRLTGKMAEIDEFFPQRLLNRWQKGCLNVRRKIAGMVATSLAAWLGALPWMVYHFGLITPIAVLASVVLIPLTFVILGLGFLSASVGMVNPSASEWVNRGNAIVAHGAYVSAREFSSVPLGHQFVGGREPADWVVFDCADGGMASYLATGEGAFMDVGSERKFYQVVRPGLLRWHASPQTVILSHPDGKHTGAMPEVMRQYEPSQVVVPVIWARSPSYREFIEEAPAGVVEVGQPGKRYDLSKEAWFEVIHEGQEDLDTLADSRGMAVKVHWHGWRVLVMGDLGVEEERDLLSRGVDVSADVVLVGRHARTYSGSYEFLEATGAKIVIASSADFPKEERPTERWREARRKLGVELFVQDETGAVLMDFTREVLCVKSYLQPEREVILERSSYE